MKPSVRIREQVKTFLEQLAPEPRRRLKLALRALADGDGDTLALREKLSGYHRLRIGGYRVIFRYLPGGVIECVYAESRSLVYKLFEQEMLERLRHEKRGSATTGESVVEEPPAKYSAGRRPKKRTARASR